MQTKVKIPKVIKMGTLDYKILFDPYIWKEEGKRAQVNYLKLLIKVDNQIPNGLRGISLLHEIVHVIDEIYSLDLDDNDTDRLAHGLADFLFNNLKIELDWSSIT